MDKFVSVKSKIEGTIEVHATDVSGNYATLCGLDGDDPWLDQYPGELPKKPIIDCMHCIQIIEHCRLYKKSDTKP